MFGVWSPTNLDAAPARRDTHVLCLYPLGAAGAGYPACTVWRGAARSAIALEAATLRRRGAVVRIVAPDNDSRAEIGPNLVDEEPRHRVISACHRQGLTLAALG